MKTCFIYLIILGINFFSCKKKPVDPPGTSAPVYNTYMPLTIGSYWNYRLTRYRDSSLNEYFTIKAVREVERHGKMWTEMECTMTNPPKSFYYRVDEDGNIWQDGIGWMYDELDFIDKFFPLIVFNDEMELYNVDTVLVDSLLEIDYQSIIRTGIPVSEFLEAGNKTVYASDYTWDMREINDEFLIGERFAFTLAKEVGLISFYGSLDPFRFELISYELK